MLCEWFIFCFLPIQRQLKQPDKRPIKHLRVVFTAQRPADSRVGCERVEGVREQSGVLFRRGLLDFRLLRKEGESSFIFSQQKKILIDKPFSFRTATRWPWTTFSPWSTSSQLTLNWGQFTWIWSWVVPVGILRHLWPVARWPRVFWLWHIPSCWEGTFDYHSLIQLSC